MSTDDNGTTIRLAADLVDATRRPRRTVWFRFRRHRLALWGLGILLLFGFGAVFAPWIAVHDPNYGDLYNVKAPPSMEHWLGTDAGGRDLFARILFAGRVSLSVGLVAAGISAVIGTVIGLVSGYAGGWVDNLLQRFTELVMTFPTFFAILIIVSIVGPSVWNIMFVIGVLGWTGKARLVRGQVLSLREMDYVTAERAIGASERRILSVAILPGVIPYVAVASTLTVAGAILTEASLSFLGIGVQIPTATWGNMMSAAQAIFVLSDMPWIWIPPGAAIGMTVIAVNFLGDGLRDALDPRSVSE
jgi:peptide/nickel transport system permease protein